MANFHSSLTLSLFSSVSFKSLLYKPSHPTNPFNSSFPSLNRLPNTFIWIPGHIGFSEHDAVDKAAKQATCFPKMTDFPRLPVSDLKNHYRSLILQSWNLFWKTQSPNKLLIKQIPSPWSSCNRNSKRKKSFSLA